LAEVRRVLFQGGIFVIDVFNPEELAQKYGEKNDSSKWKEYPSFYLQQKRTISQNGDWLCDLWTIRDKAADGQSRFFEHSVRLYTQGGLRGLLENTGFTVEGVYGGYEGENFSPNSVRLIFLVRAK
jgi:hypothetical protein